MKSSMIRIVAVSSGLYAIACSLFFIVLWRLGASGLVWAAAAVFAAAIAVLFAGYTWSVRSKMSDVVQKLSQTIQSLSDLEERELFSAYEDSLLSKLQHQVIQLSRTMKSRQLKYKEEGDEIKSLISDIAHQLKTPLANLNMYLALLSDPDLSSDIRKEFTDVLMRQAERLTWQMESLIKMSRLEGGIIAIRLEKQDIVDTVLAALKEVYLLAESKEIELLLQGEKSLLLKHDARWTGEAIGNLLDNAIKYSRKGGKVTIAVTRYELFVRIDIEDEGIGVEEREFNAIFKRFYRGDNASSTEGVGIGLYLARKIISEQNGYIKVSSQLGRGSRFSLFLPL
ncbi:sensor histidine kinase KdpD [Paenibacillus sp. NEAU-GSW1]|uniref:sensor histidine kinase n=1 Tax=Paenibacillus sp. NEAU-GSW1 TaxID=2682486 RepID=UPI0012E2F0E8|nr:HAMP domain-containing sensor histidine kinase [Paenibacillus sp. NEAU-GSW1]MUT65380.1 sensor histidine kinase [Paenibacillus sp. NEAU-GSW1]